MKVAVVTGLCVQHDAISNSVRDSVTMLGEEHDTEVRLYAYRCDFPELPYCVVQTAADLALDPFFRVADLVIFHFGVFYPLFNAVFLLHGRQPVLGWFHNITPKEHVKPEHHAVIDRSFEQIANLEWTDHVVCDSETNRVVLQEHGIRTGASVVPLAVPNLGAAPDVKPGHADGLLRLVFIGRFVQSKGCDDLVEACIAAARRRPDLTMRLDVVGNTLFADLSILARLRALSGGPGTARPANLSIHLHESVDDATKMRLLAEADLFVLPTYHEGFCVPIVEALASGCRVVSYANSNVPAIADGMATLVETGQVAQLADAVVGVAADVTSAAWRSTGYRAYRARCGVYATRFSLDRFAGALRHIVRTHARRPGRGAQR